MLNLANWTKQNSAKILSAVCPLVLRVSEFHPFQSITFIMSLAIVGGNQLPLAPHQLITPLTLILKY